MIVPDRSIDKSLILCGELEVGSLNESSIDGITPSKNPSEDFKNYVLRALKFSSFYTKKGSKSNTEIDEHVETVESGSVENEYALVLPSNEISISNFSETCKKIFVASGFKKGNPIRKTNESYYYKLSPDKVNVYIATGTRVGIGENSNIILSFRCCENKKEITDIIETGDIAVSASQKRLNGEQINAAQQLYSESGIKPDHIDYSSIERSSLFNKVVNEYFDLSHRPTRQHLISLDEAGQNAVITSLTSKLYDKIVAKCDDIDYGEIPATKGDIRKLSKYEDMKETIQILHDLLKEYKQDTGPVDELSVALSNIEARRDLFEKAYRYNSELPMVVYCNITLAIIAGISYMIATCVEYIKDPGTNTFRAALDRNAYNRTKDHTIYNSLRQFNKSCASQEFDKAMDAIMKAQTKNFAGAGVIGAVAIGAVGTILVLIPVLRELIFLFYYCRMSISDFFNIQADLLTMNAYSIENNGEFTKQDKKEIIDRQLKFVNAFRKIANTVSFEMKKAEVEADKEKKSDDNSKELINDIGGVDTGANGSALF